MRPVLYLPGSDVPQSAVYLVLKLLYLSECQGLKLLPHEIPETGVHALHKHAYDKCQQMRALLFTSRLYMRHDE